jgi:hypothetical protein
MKNLSAVTKQEQKQFFDSFDHVLFDVDGKTVIQSDRKYLFVY